MFLAVIIIPFGYGKKRALFHMLRTSLNHAWLRGRYEGREMSFLVNHKRQLRKIPEGGCCTKSE